MPGMQLYFTRPPAEDRAMMTRQAPILTITLNPALDISTSVAEVIAGPKLRCTAPVTDPGGGGLNVSRAVKALGGRSLALVALAGATGTRLQDLLTAEGIDFVAIPAPGETRQSMTVTEETSGKQFRFMLPGSDWTVPAQDRVFARLADLVRPDGFAVISGSQPPGVPRDFPARMAAAMTGMQVVLDTSGAALFQAVAQPVPGLSLLRMNDAEAEELAGTPLPDRIHTADFASELVARGVAQRVIVARGADGSVLAEAGRRLWRAPPAVPVRSKVGAGDSFVGAWVLSMARGLSTEDALHRAVAAAASAVTSEGTDLCHASDVDALLPRCTGGNL